MKTILKEFYNLNILDYKEYDNGITFFVGGETYYLYKVFDNVEFVMKIYDYVRSNYKLKLHTLIKNINNEYFSNGYILMKLNMLIDEIDIYDVNKFGRCNMNVFKKDYVNIIDSWKNNLDYYSEKIKDNEFIDKRYLFDYFNGISELLLKFISDVDISSIDLVLSHKKDYNNTLDYYNPFNLCVDVRFKDLIWYLKNNNRLDEILNYINVSNYNERKLLFFMILFPFEILDSFEVKDVLKYENDFDKYQELFSYYLLQIKKSN